MASPSAPLGSAPFRFELGLRRGSGDFFRNRAEDDVLLEERRHWLKAQRSQHCAVDRGSNELLREAVEFAREFNPGISPEPFDTIDPLTRCAALGKEWAPDFLLLGPDGSGCLRLRAGCVCFPSHWSLPEKLGLPMREIHAPVPGMNDVLGRQIDAFMENMRSGTFWERWNWGLAASPERNLHPERAFPRLTATTPPKSVWLRAEHQSFARLPRTGALLFGIRLVLTPLSEFASDAAAARRLADLLETMPEEIARYKGLSAIKPHVSKFLSGAASTGAGV